MNIRIHRCSVLRFLYPFINELNLLYTKGFEFNGNVCRVKMLRLVGDSKAKVELLSCKHSGFKSCPACLIKCTRRYCRDLFFHEEAQLSELQLSSQSPLAEFSPLNTWFSQPALKSESQLRRAGDIAGHARELFYSPQQALSKDKWKQIRSNVAANDDCAFFRLKYWDFACYHDIEAMHLSDNIAKEFSTLDLGVTITRPECPVAPTQPTGSDVSEQLQRNYEQQRGEYEEKMRQYEQSWTQYKKDQAVFDKWKLTRQQIDLVDARLRAVTAPSGTSFRKKKYLGLPPASIGKNIVRCVCSS